MVYNITEREVQPATYNHINGSTEEILARFCVSELYKGWPVYRDASEWNNYRSLFTDDAYVWTTWSGGLTIDDFIKVSKEGRANGDFIMHRENGTLIDLNLSKSRAVGKLKATITQRFTIEGMQVDIDCDVRFIFFCLKIGNEWKVKYYKSFYEKDKVMPVDGKNVPTFKKELLEEYPEEYQYLAVAQHMIGHPVLKNLATMNNEGFYKMYDAMHDWLEGKDIDLFWGEKKP
ncbi:related to pathogenicity cluster PEP2 [Phialocephala subalpina]|uniref:Related to pathogenicity cluster PEP2 n=1 Tax=Phialocephala subalpina TaxID=576137 RepID=A0A1L7XAV3_9HELO|nr:related to pathogenicity cluster PEP2 [Phialocephala subalpina]